MSETPPAESAPQGSLFPLITGELANLWAVWANDGKRFIFGFNQSEKKTVEDLVGAINEHVAKDAQEQPPRQEGETPETDQQSIRAEAAFRAGAEHVVTADFARKLERQRNAAERRAADAEAGQHNAHKLGADAIEALEAKLEAAEAERDRLNGILRRLVAAKQEKERHGETHIYKALKAGAWEDAKKALSNAEPDTLPADYRFVEVEKPHPDSLRLDWLQRESCDLRCFDMPTGQGDADIGWSVISHHMAEPHWRVEAEVFRDDCRAAIDQAMTNQP